MEKLEYIPGDLVKFATNTYTIVNFEENFLHNKICYALISTNSTKTAFVADRDILPIPLTPEILEKNGWKKEAMSRGIRIRNLVYTKPDIEEYGYFPIYIEKGIGDEFDVYPFTDNNVCKPIAYIKYVHQLQHLLFGLGLNSLKFRK
jgi:hypothetical protein